MDDIPDDDPTRVLDGWRAPAADTAIDPTRVLDGWTAQQAAQSRRGGRPLERIEPPPTLIDVAALTAGRPTRSGEPDLDLHTASRRGRWDKDDVTDIEPLVLHSADFAAAQPASADAWTPEPSHGAAPSPHPRLLAQWQPQAWIGAVKRVFGPVAQVVSTRDGPVVDTFAPHRLVALWAPQSLGKPFLDRWPLRVALSAAPADAAGVELLAFMPDDASLWLAEHDIDWALVGEAVLLHQAGLRDFQLTALRAFVEAEKQADFDRANAAYKPATAAGQPLEHA